VQLFLVLGVLVFTVSENPRINLADYFGSMLINLQGHFWLYIPLGIVVLLGKRKEPGDLSLAPVSVAINFWTAVIKLHAIITMRDQKRIRHQGVEGISQGVLTKSICKN